MMLIYFLRLKLLSRRTYHKLWRSGIIGTGFCWTEVRWGIEVCVNKLKRKKFSRCF